jgi:hypothetical protein
MGSFIRWAVVVLAVLVVVGLVAFARGPEHQRGDEMGAMVSLTGAPVSAG